MTIPLPTLGKGQLRSEVFDKLDEFTMQTTDLSKGVFSALVVKNEKYTDEAITVQLLKMIDDNE